VSLRTTAQGFPVVREYRIGQQNNFIFFILIGENVLNFHADNDSYYEEWYEDLNDGWICFLNFRDHVIKEFESYNLDYYLMLGGKFNNVKWRTLTPHQLFELTEQSVIKRLQ
jgi:hypothetical protein